MKANNVVTLYVDDLFTYPGIGEAWVSYTDTNDRLYIGGVPGTFLNSVIFQFTRVLLCLLHERNAGFSLFRQSQISF